MLTLIKPEAAHDVLVRLGSLLRRTLADGDRRWISMAEEIGFLRAYLEIETTRFADRLTVQFEIADDVSHVPVPPLILQPLVENAIRHGISERVDGGRLAIRARRENGRLICEVEDDGPGISLGSGGGEGVGLSNVRARLAAVYGGQAELSLLPARPSGVIARIQVPASLSDSSLTA
jgi:LytS/YehU family sensor histidine kinase